MKQRKKRNRTKNKKGKERERERERERWIALNLCSNCAKVVVVVAEVENSEKEIVKKPAGCFLSCLS